jgi:hypothetical protein
VLDYEPLLVLDADLSNRLASELRKRSRDAVSAKELGLAADVLDPQLLRALRESYHSERRWILVTGDDTLPAEHGHVVTETEATVATIHPVYPEAMTEHAWRCDVVHRWAHAMQAQPPGSVRRYAGNGSQVWKPRRRHLRRIAKEGWRPWRPAPPAGEDGGADSGPEATRLRGMNWV